jgi:phosphoglycolate phosphatase
VDAVGLRPFFAFCAGPELSASGEDKGITIASALVRLGGGDAVMIGDRGLDIVGARACSIPAIGVTWGAGSVEELGSVNPDAIVDVPAQLPGAIAAIIASSSPSAPGPAQATARGPAQADR